MLCFFFLVCLFLPWVRRGRRPTHAMHTSRPLFSPSFLFVSPAFRTLARPFLDTGLTQSSIPSHRNRIHQFTPAPSVGRSLSQLSRRTLLHASPLAFLPFSHTPIPIPSIPPPTTTLHQPTNESTDQSITQLFLLLGPAAVKRPKDRAEEDGALLRLDGHLLLSWPLSLW